MYRIWCEFKPSIKRAAGGDGMGPRQGRGAWVVVVCGFATVSSPVLRRDSVSSIGLLCPTRRRVGTRCNPRKLLAEYQAARNTYTIVIAAVPNA